MAGIVTFVREPFLKPSARVRDRNEVFSPGSKILMLSCLLVSQETFRERRKSIRVKSKNTKRMSRVNGIQKLLSAKMHPNIRSFLLDYYLLIEEMVSEGSGEEEMAF